MSTKLTTADAEQLADQHQALEREIDEWREWWHELDELGEPRFDEMGARLRRFHSDLAEHFRLEEESGFIDRLTERSPNRRGEVDSVHRQHGELLRRLDNLVGRLSHPEVGHETWGAARHDFEAFLDALHAHEVLEHVLGGELPSEKTGNREQSR